MRPTLLLLLLPLLSAPAAGQRYPVASGPHVDVVCWFANERHGDDLAASALAVAEDARAAARAALGLGAEEVAETATRTVVNVYENRRGTDGFAEAVDALEPGASEGVAAWNHPASHGVFVKLQPVANNSLLEELGFPPVSLHHVARQTALLELALAGADPAHPAGPRWLREGLATWIADRVLVAHGRFVEGTLDPAVSTRVRTTRRLRRAGRSPDLGQWLAGETGDATAEEVHAVDAMLMRFLAERLEPERLAEFAGPAARGDVPPELATTALFAAMDLEGADELEHRWATWLEGLPAPWEDEYPALARWGDEGGWIQAAATPRFALCWHEPPPAKNYVIRAEVEVFRNPTDTMGQINFALGRMPDGAYVSIAFNSHNGVLVWDYTPGRSDEGDFVVMTPIALGTGPIPRRKYRITLHVVDGRLTPFIRDLSNEESLPQRLRPFAVEGRDMSGPWGIGTIRGSAAIWHSLTIEPYDEAGAEGASGRDEDSEDDGDSDR